MTSNSNTRYGHTIPMGNGSSSSIPSGSRSTAHSQLHESTISESISKANKPRFRLSKEGVKILQDTYDSGITNPDPRQKQELLDRIRAIPGNEEYPMRNLATWFVNKRARSGARSGAGTQATVSTATSSQPTSSTAPADNPSKFQYLTPKNILTLNTLFYQGNTNPSQELVDTWAELLSTETAAVTAWVEAEKEKLTLESMLPHSIQGRPTGQQPKQPSAPPIVLDLSRNILTPSSSTSPEPPPPASSAFPSEPTTPLSPITPRPFVKLEEERRPFIIPNLPPTKDPVRRDLLLAIHKELSDPQHKTPYRHPKTREELSALFGSCTRPMEEFLDKVKSGSLEKFGFKSNWA